MVIPSSAEACKQEIELGATRAVKTISLHALEMVHLIFISDRNGEYHPELASQTAKQLAQALALGDLLAGTDESSFGVSDEVCTALRGAFAAGGLDGLEAALATHGLVERLMVGPLAPTRQREEPMRCQPSRLRP
jgi:hypothetical protein